MEVWSFFSGAMGLDLGFDRAGLPPTVCVEVNSDCCETIRRNRPGLDVIQQDVTLLTGADLRKHRRFDGDVLVTIGGPPCQSFSPAGKRAALNDPRGNLIYEYIRLISEIMPCYFVLENVANLATAALRHRAIADRPGKHWSLKRYDKDGTGQNYDAAPLEPDERSSSALRQIITDVDAIGYNVVFAVVDAADYGAPQHRLRFVMIGARAGMPPMIPAPSHGKGPELLPFRTVRDAIWRLRDNPGVHSEYTEPVRDLFGLVPTGGNWRSLPVDLHERALGGAFRAGGGKTGFYRRLPWDSPAPTITGRANRKGSALCHPEAVRPLSVPECAAIQGFPSDWQFTGSMNSQYQQVGNAVPVQLGEAIGRSVAACHFRQLRTVSLPSSEEMLQKSLNRLRASARNTKCAAGSDQPTLDLCLVT
jgi:DNA (cytosine-5)-methyltransferase 1